jgi:hypothetical protein
MLYDTSNLLQAEQFKLRAAQLAKSGKVVELTEKKPVRSDNQNKYLHVIIGYFASQYGCGFDEAKVRFYKKICNPEIYLVDNPKRKGEKVLRSSSGLDTREMTASIERFRNYSADRAGIYLPSPEDERLLQLAEVEIERNKTFI